MKTTYQTFVTEAAARGVTAEQMPSQADLIKILDAVNAVAYREEMNCQQVQDSHYYAEDDGSDPHRLVFWNWESSDAPDEFDPIADEVMRTGILPG